jgi:hypothetical protein
MLCAVTLALVIRASCLARALRLICIASKSLFLGKPSYVGRIRFYTRELAGDISFKLGAVGVEVKTVRSKQ